ncbi:Bug family tripartite tricarboxylate transporter substrate binding protein [Hydrogenophaga sp.]|uniref:Bug family tripartite tricarboxylate transporter substrate binding protein n=1 Tax=Hydrogenophaga sp. TaxID=1904254 RepID=UPI0035AF78C9
MTQRTVFTAFNRRRATAALGAALLAASLSPLAHAQDTRPARLLLGFPAGGSFDAIARLLAEKLKTELGRPVIVDNKPGAGGRIAMDLLKNAPADGSVVMFAPGAITSLYPYTVAKLNYDPKKDLAPIGTVAEFPFAVAVSASSKITNLRELIAAAKANSAQAMFGTPAVGAPPHFYGLAFGEAAGVKLDPIPFQGSAPVNQALMGNQIPMGVDVMGSMVENHKGGKIRVLAVSTEQRAPQLPDVPTFAEQGFASVTGGDFNAFFAPAGTPAPALAAWSKALSNVLAQAEVKDKLLTMGFIPVGKGPEELANRAAAQAKRWEAIVKSSGFVAQ